MNLVNEVHLVAPARRRILDVVQQVASIVNLGLRSSVYLDQVHESAFVDFDAGTALATGLGRDAFLAVECFRQDPGDGRLTDPACSGK